jgi:hypothetical protein
MAGPPDSEVSPAEAAFHAGAQYVYSASYSKGYEDGWARGWQEALTEGCASETTGTRHKPLNRLDPVEQRGQEDVPREALELSEEWAKIFADGAARRAAAVAAEEQAEARQEAVISGVAIDLGGRAEAQRQREAKQLYGERASEILAANAALDAQFADASSRTCAPLWPAVSLADLVGMDRG